MDAAHEPIVSGSGSNDAYTGSPLGKRSKTKD